VIDRRTVSDSEITIPVALSIILVVMNSPVEPVQSTLIVAVTVKTEFNATMLGGRSKLNRFT